MNEYKVDVVFSVNAEDIHQAYRIVAHEIQKNIPFKGVPYSHTDSGIKNFQNNGVDELQIKLDAAEQVIQSIANEQVELSHDKIKWQNGDHIKWCKDYLNKAK